MHTDSSETALEDLRARVAPLARARALGRVAGISGGRLYLSGLSDTLRLGDEVTLRGTGLHAEVVALGEQVIALPCGDLDGAALGTLVEPLGPATVAPGPAWLGRVIDPFGAPLDGRPLVSGTPRALHAPAPDAAGRGGFGPRLDTGRVAFDTLLPLAEGQRIGIFAGSGVGKSHLLLELARNVAADVVVAALVGERGREVSAFARDVFGPDRPGVVIAATSDRPANVRLRALPAAVTTAEAFRDAGAKVLLVCDSLTRHAEAFAELAEAAPGTLPPGLVSGLAACLERLGPAGPDHPPITAVATVLAAGSDLEGPIADAARGLLDGHVVLSREIAETGRYPAIDVLASVSRALPGAASEAENALVARARAILELRSRNALLVSSGLYEAGRDPALDAALRIAPKLDEVLVARADGAPAAFAALDQALKG